ncbi:MAG: hypothetical protein LH650_10305 [Chloroflexi bacterium]|nr:hypothetical protein [Chloroflexota bacterium]
MADPSIRLQDPDLRARLLRAMDVEARIPAALQTLGPVTDRHVCVVEDAGGALAGQLLGQGGWIRSLAGTLPASMGSIPDSRADVLVAGWTGFRPGSTEWEEQLLEARRVLRPDGRLLVVHDYGRDEVTNLIGDAPRATELIDWSRPSGPFLGYGFRIRVLHCWWRWDTQDEATEVLTLCFGDAGADLAATMRRPRLAWKVAVYHLSMDAAATDDAAAAKLARAAKRQARTAASPMPPATAPGPVGPA